MRVAVLGINYKVADIALREYIAQAFLRHFTYTSPFPDKETSFVLVSTCNRAEIYFSSYDLTTTHQEILAILRNTAHKDVEQKCYSFFGLDCFQHLVRVTAGLDSAVLAETEIQGQIRKAYHAATIKEQLASDLHFLFQKSLKIAKDVRTKFLQQREIFGIEHAIFSHMKTCDITATSSILFIGISEINLKVAKFFSQKGFMNITFANRNIKTLQMIHDSYQTVSLESFYTTKQHYACIIAATKSPYYLLNPSNYTYTHKPLLIDLAVPRNIDPAISDNICNIDSLQRMLIQKKQELKTSIETAELFIQTKTKQIKSKKIINLVA